VSDFENISIQPVKTAKQISQFLDVPYDLYRKDPNWAPPLRLERKDQLNPEKNPAAKNLDRLLFLAEMSGNIVGRIAVFTNPAHDHQHDKETAFFGYFDCENNAELGQALLEAAKEWAVEKGRTRLVGPAQWGVNEEVGLLIDGFDTPNVVLMSYGKPYYQTMVETAGFTKAIDLYAFQADLHEGYPRPKMTTMMVDYATRSKSVSWRKLDTKNFKQDIEVAMDIFNDAWSENWGFLEFPDEAIQHLAKEMKPLIAADCFYMGYIDGEPAAYICLIPDLNELARGFDGKLLPFNWAKLLFRLKKTGAKQARIPLMGLKRKYHNTRKGLGLVAALCETVFEAARQNGYTHCELSWVLEGNDGMISICEQASAVPYKTYRMYEMQIE